MFKRVSNKIVRTAKRTLYEFGVPQTFINPHARINKIIMYHGIDLVENKQYNHRFIGVDHLFKQLKYLKNNANILTVQDFFEGNFKQGNNVAITFDDGYLNNYKYVLPIVEELQIPVMIYVTGLNRIESPMLWPDFIDLHSSYLKEGIVVENEQFELVNKKLISTKTRQTLSTTVKLRGDYPYKEKVYEAFFQQLGHNFTLENSLDDYWKLMSDDQILKIAQSNYIEIGSHGFLHNNLGNTLLAHSVEELSISKKYLENLLQREIQHLAYPDGSYTRELIDQAHHLGFKYQLAAENYLYPTFDLEDKRILDRTGFYPVYSWAFQLDQFFKEAKKYV